MKSFNFLFLFLLILIPSTFASLQDEYLDNFKISAKTNLVNECESLCEEQEDQTSCESLCISKDNNCFEMQEGILVLDMEMKSLDKVPFDVPVCQMTSEAISNGLEPNMPQSLGELLTFDGLKDNFGLSVVREYREYVNDGRLASEEDAKDYANWYQRLGIAQKFVAYLYGAFLLALVVFIGKDFLIETKKEENKHKPKGPILWAIIMEWIKVIGIVTLFMIVIEIVLGMI